MIHQTNLPITWYKPEKQTCQRCGLRVKLSFIYQS